MDFPLEQLVEFDGNIYEITVAASLRAFQLAKLAKLGMDAKKNNEVVDDPEIESIPDKVVCEAARQLFNKKVTYRIENKQ